jgi:hypothetical protein
MEVLTDVLTAGLRGQKLGDRLWGIARWLQPWNVGMRGRVVVFPSRLDHGHAC